MADSSYSGIPIQFPSRRFSPVRALELRIALAVALVLFVTFVAYFGRGGYVDKDESVTLLDCFYYATVSITTTGYGDVTPVSDGARLATAILITPARILFLVLLVGTTLELLASATRENLRRRLWRRTLKDHIVICGFGTKGHAALSSLLGAGADPHKIVIIDPRADAIEDAGRHGVAAIHGSATQREVLLEACVQDAAAIVVAADRDDTAVLVTLSARELAPSATITAGAREEENAALLRRSGADTVVTSSSAAGRLLGLGTAAPEVVATLEDLLSSGQGLDVVAEDVGRDGAGSLADYDARSGPVLQVLRGNELMRRGHPGLTDIKAGDRVIHVVCHPVTAADGSSAASR